MLNHIVTLNCSKNRTYSLKNPNLVLEPIKLYINSIVSDISCGAQESNLVSQPYESWMTSVSPARNIISFTSLWEFQYYRKLIKDFTKNYDFDTIWA